ncbi:MAG: lipase family protein [Alphaproteobacteria bacterium]
MARRRTRKAGRRRARRFGAGLLAVAAIAAGLLAGLWLWARPAEPDAFYDAGAAVDGPPGTLLRSERFGRGVPAAASGWRILHATTRRDGSAAVASAIVLVPAARPAGPWRAVAWTHGTTGVARGCAPSVLDRPFANVPALDAALGQGWLIIATDYVGLGGPGRHAYLVGDEAARAALDAVRAAAHLPAVGAIGDVVVWGHSQGGNTALWAGIRAPGYAAELPVRGVAALAPASDLPSLLATARATMFGKIVSAYLVEGYAAAYPDLDAWAEVAPLARPLARDIAGRCVGGLETLVSVAETWLLPSAGIFAGDPTAGALGRRLAENVPDAPVAAPLLVAQGEFDDLVSPAVQAAYVARRCAAGQAIDYRTYPGRDHISVLAEESGLPATLIEWTAARFDGRPATDNCRR